MTIKSLITLFGIATFLAMAASLLSLSSHLPLPLAYFAIALLAACLTQLSGGKGKANSGRDPANPGSKEKGQVKWFSASKGFGFITRANGEDIFVHFRSISGSGHRILREGQRVEFLVREGDKGLQAEEVLALK